MKKDGRRKERVQIDGRKNEIKREEAKVKVKVKEEEEQE